MDDFLTEQEKDDYIWKKSQEIIMVLHDETPMMSMQILGCVVTSLGEYLDELADEKLDD